MIKLNKTTETTYKGFAILKKGNKWQILNKGEVIKECDTLKEAKERIKNQTI
jgi:hypothetical protein